MSTPSPSQGAWAIIQGLDGVDQKLLAHPGVAHIPSILEADELPDALTHDGAGKVLVATDRRIVEIETSVLRNSVRKVTSYPYETILSFQADKGFLAPGFSMVTAHGPKLLAAKKDGREQFGAAVNSHLPAFPPSVPTVSSPMPSAEPKEDAEENLDPKTLAVAHAVRNMDGWDRSRTASEGKELPSILWENELPEMIVAGSYHLGNGMLVATDRRVLFVDKGMLSLKVEDFGYDKISSVESKGGMVMGEIKIYVAGNSATFGNVEKGQARAFADFVRSKVNKRSAGAEPVAAAGGTADELLKFAELLSKGIITQEEFDAQKARLIGS